MNVVFFIVSQASYLSALPHEINTLRLTWLSVQSQPVGEKNKLCIGLEHIIRSLWIHIQLHAFAGLRQDGTWPEDIHL